jgi:D-3-phosphoglycerate dehydrogenase / 2-oxoglutarate reductase
MARVLVTARNAASVRDLFERELAAAGVELVMAPRPGQAKTEAELLELLPGCLAAIAMVDDYTARVIEASAPTLKLIVRSGVGYDSVDVEAATRHGVWVATTPGANHDAVADFAMLQILALARDFVANVNRTRGGGWERVTGLELRDKTLAVIGTGRVGKETAARARGFGMRVVAHDVIEDAAWAAGVGVTYRPLAEALAQADVVTLHTPLLPATRHLLNAATLAGCKRGVLIVNTARGPLIDEHALADALDSGQVGGAALDVFDQEPPIDRLIVDHPRVLPTAHSAGGTAEASRRAAIMTIEEVLRVARGERPKHPVNDLG